MKFILIQISDIHIKGANPKLVEKMRLIAKAVRHLDAEIQTAIVMLTGDVANAGLQPEYNAAGSLCAELKTALTEELAGTRVHFLGVPGNHDCDFKHPMAQPRGLVLESLARSISGPIEEGTLKLCCSVHDAFFTFLDNLQSLPPSYNQARAYYEYLIPVGNTHILFRCFNTAISSTLPENPGHMVYPISLLKDRSFETPPEYIVGLFHHPYNWLAPNVKRVFSEHVERTCDLIFTGHEHATAYYKKEAFSGLVSEYIEGAVFQEHGMDDCGFNTAIVNLASSQERIYTSKWSDDHFITEEVTDGWRPFRRTRTHRDFEVTEQVREWLQDPGAAFVHPGKEKLLLEDIYVPPNAQELILKNGKDLVRNSRIDSRDLLTFISNKHRTLIVGKERVGKSTLAKVLFRHFYSKEQIPVLIDGNEIKSTDPERFEKLVTQRIKQDYCEPLLDKLKQLYDDRVVLIIDDFDHAKLNARGRLKLIESMLKRFSRLVILGDDMLWFEEMASGELGSQILSDFTQLELMEYGHVLRSAIIDKWYDVNREYITNPDELDAKVQRAEGLIDNILGKSYLPSFPIFILTLLQGFDTAEPVDSSSASYGYLYTVLVNKKLAEGDRELSFDKKLGYLVELAFHLFTNKQRELSKEEFTLFHIRHCSQYVPIDQRLMLIELERAGILELFHDNYRFKYSYFYYYFVAEYLSRHIETPAVKERLEVLCKGLQNEENANIWLFLTHQSRSSFVLETIVKHATQFFASIAPPKFDDAVSFLTTLYEKVPELVYTNRTIGEMRDDRRKRLDAEFLKADDGVGEGEETNETLKTIVELKIALRTLEVMGQIVKNYAGSMRNEPKMVLVKQCYELGLRVIGVVFNPWLQAGNEFVDSVFDVVFRKDDGIESKEELEKMIKRFIFFFCESASFNVIKRISHAVGAKDLENIYPKLLETNPTNAYRLIDLSVKLDSIGFPKKLVYDLADSFMPIAPSIRRLETGRDANFSRPVNIGGNIFCGRLLSRLVIHHFYLFHTDDATKQLVCDKLGIKMQAIRGIDAKSEKQKMLPRSSED